jgi:hypothetical protein
MLVSAAGIVTEEQSFDIFFVGQSECRQASTTHNRPPSQEIGNITLFSSQMNVAKVLQPFLGDVVWYHCISCCLDSGYYL